MIAATGGDVAGLWIAAAFVWGFLVGTAFGNWMNHGGRR